MHIQHNFLLLSASGEKQLQGLVVQPLVIVAPLAQLAYFTIKDPMQG